MIYKHNVVFLCNILFFRIKSEKSFVFRRKIIGFLKLTNHIVDFPLTAACLGVCCFVFDVISGIVQQPSLLPVIDLKFQNLHNISGDLPVGDREHDFDPPVEVAGASSRHWRNRGVFLRRSRIFLRVPDSGQ